MALIKAGEVSINPEFVASMEWDRRWYANGPGDTTLIVYMHDGRQHRLKHAPHLMGGIDAYAVHDAIERDLSRISLKASA